MIERLRDTAICLGMLFGVPLAAAVVLFLSYLWVYSHG